MDFTYLNKHTIPLNYTLPQIQSLYTLLTPRHKWFSTIDLKDAFFSLPLHEDTRQYAGISTHIGNFIPMRAQFGLMNAPSKFCELIGDVISGLESYVFSYIDDFLIFSESLEEHLLHLEEFLIRLDKWGLFVNEDKSYLAKKQVHFVGHLVSSEGIRPIADKVEALKNLKPPSTLTGVRSFLGSINYYRRHLPSLAETVDPITALLKGPKGRPKNFKIVWGPEQQTAFQNTIKLLSNVATLALEDPDQPLVLTTDASGKHVGAVLEQFTTSDEEATRPLAFFSKALPESCRARSTFFRELNGIYLSVRFFKHRILGRRLIIRTDHSPLVQAINNGWGDHSIDEMRKIYYIKEFLPELRFIEGKRNSMADYLSRPDHDSDIPRAATKPFKCAAVTTRSAALKEHCSIPDTRFALSSHCSMVSPKLLATAQQQDQDFIASVRESLSRPNSVMAISAIQLEGDSNLTLYGVVSPPSKHFRPIVPEELQAFIFHQFHDVIHQGQEKSVDIIQAHYYWPGMTKAIKSWVASCPKCQCCKTTRHNRAKLSNFPADVKRLQTVHIDIVGPIVPSNGYKYILTMRCRTTGFTIAAPLRNKSSASVIRAFKFNFIAVFGIPSVVVTDNGGEFLSNAFDLLCADLGVVHRTTTAYHAQANGCVERVHRTMKTALRALDDPSSWESRLPLIILTINNMLVDENKFSPFQKMIGQPGQLPGSCLYDTNSSDPHMRTPSIRAFFENMENHVKQVRPLRDNKPYLDKALSNCSHVWLKNDAPSSSLAPLYTGPYKVESRHEKYFSILSGSSILSNVSIDRLKAAILPSEQELSESDSESDSDRLRDSESSESPENSTCDLSNNA